MPFNCELSIFYVFALFWLYLGAWNLQWLKDMNWIKIQAEICSIFCLIMDLTILTLYNFEIFIFQYMISASSLVSMASLSQQGCWTANSQSYDIKYVCGLKYDAFVVVWSDSNHQVCMLFLVCTAPFSFLTYFKLKFHMLMLSSF